MPNPLLFVVKLQLYAFQQWLALVRGALDLYVGPPLTRSSPPAASPSRNLLPLMPPDVRRER